MSLIGYQVSSSQLDIVGHNATTNTLTIVFQPSSSTGKISIYEYRNVSASLFDQLMSSSSHGSFFIQNIKKDKVSYPYTEITGKTANQVFDQIVPSSQFGPNVQAFSGFAATLPYGGFSAASTGNASWCW